MPIFDRTFKADPYGFYREARDRGPVARVKLPTGVDCWLVTEYALARSLLLDDRLSKDSRDANANWHRSRVTFAGRDSRPLFRHLLTMNPPDHSRLRRLVASSFAPARIRGMRDTVRSVVEEALDQLPAGEVVDFVSGFAAPVPLTMISEILGVPIADRPHFRRWSELLMSADEDERDSVPTAASELSAYLLEQIERRRKEPDESLFGGLIAALDRDEMSEQELVALGFIILVAGHETTMSLLSAGLLILLETPGAWDGLCAEPATAAAAVEELLRLCAPVEVATPRFATATIEVGRAVIAPGDTVYIGLAAANRDPARFERPDEYDADRASGHLAFGHGIHFCLGAFLARLEGTVALEALARRFPRIELAAPPEELPWKPGLLMRGLQAMPVRLAPGSGG